MHVLDKTELSQWATHRVLGEQERAGGGNLKVLGNYIAKGQAVCKRRSVSIDCVGITTTNALIVIIIIPGEVSGMVMAIDRVSALGVQCLHLFAKRIITTNCTAQQD